MSASSRNRRRINPLYAGFAHRLPRDGKRALRVDAARGVFDYDGIEAGAARILRRPGDAKIGGKAGAEDAFEAALLEITSETGRPAIGFIEREYESVSWR